MFVLYENLYPFDSHLKFRKKEKVRWWQVWGIRWVWQFSNPFSRRSGTNHEQSFRFLKSRVTIFRTVSRGISNLSYSSVMVNRRSRCNSSRTLSMIVFVLLVMGRPLQCPSSTLSRSLLNFLHHAYTVFKATISSLYTCFSIAWFSPADLPNLYKNFKLILWSMTRHKTTAQTKVNNKFIE